MTDFEHTQEMELSSWFENSDQTNQDKYIREVIRYPLLKKQMGLEHLDTSKMVVWDIGCGPFGGVSTTLRASRITRIDPLGKDYAKFYPQTNMLSLKAEELGPQLGTPDLIIITNALDHFLDPERFLSDLVKYMKPGAFFAHLHAIDNAYSHKHEAHAHNVNPELFATYLQDDFEIVWHQDFQRDGLTYGWRKQPAFSGLYRKVSGYGA